MKVIETSLPGMLIIDPDVFGDSRGFFMETYNEARYRDAGLPRRFVQDNLSFSARGVLRGLHYQNPDAQGKLLYVLSGEVFDVAVDIRAGSPTFGEWAGVTLSEENHRQLWIPEGFAHGFQVASESALLVYKCTALYNRESEGAILWNDPEIGIEWPIGQPTLSDKDRAAPTLREMPKDALPPYAGE